MLVLEEPDERFELNVRATRSGALVVIWAASRDTREVWVVDAASPTSTPRSVGGRRPGMEYHAEHVVLPDGTDTLLLVTNDDATEFRLARCPVPREADQDHTRGRRPGPSTPTSGWSGSTRSPGTPCSASGRRPSTGCACCRSTPSTPTAS